MYPKDLYYTTEHEWLKVDGESCTIGITDFAQAELGEVVFVDLPEIGDSFEEGDELGSIESVKAVAEVYTPITGEIEAVNSELEDAPELVNEAPHDKGWLVKIKVSADADYSEMMSAEKYQEFLKQGE